jgi:hypothetical protein
MSASGIVLFLIDIANSAAAGAAAAAMQITPKRRALAYTIGCIKPHETCCVTLHNEWSNFVSSHFGCAKPTTKVRIT